MSDMAEREPVERLAEEFIHRYRAGERPALSEYVAAHPEHAAEIRDLFPALVMMEELGPNEESTGSMAEEEAAASQFRARDRIGDYQVLREIGRGGMGTVYEAEQLSLGRRVALKVLALPPGKDASALERFRREARAAAQLHHTNIVPVFEVGQQAEFCFYAMQLIHGQGLDEVIKELRRVRSVAGAGKEHQSPASAVGRPSQAVRPANEPPRPMSNPSSVCQSLLLGRFETPTEGRETRDEGRERKDESRGAEDTHPSLLAPCPSFGDADLSASGACSRKYFQSVARIGVQAAEALAYAHQRGIIHRDVKPSNLLLDTAGVLWVTDFGLAKHTSLGIEGDGVCLADLTHTGDVVGTARYLAPERFRGQCDARTDVYGLGLTLYELLTLIPAFDNPDRLRLIEEIGKKEPARPRLLDRRIPADLETIVLKAIEKEPRRRFASADELAEDLRRFLADRPIRARRSRMPERLGRWCRRNPLVASLLILVVLMFASIAAVSTIAALRLNQALDDTRGAERQARLREAEALLGKAYGLRNSRRSGQRFEALNALREAVAIGRELDQPAGWFDRARNEAIAALALPDIHVTHEITNGFPEGSVWADLSADFELYARTTDKGACSVRRVADDREIARLPELGEEAEVEFGPGRLLALRGRPSALCQLWDLGGAEPVLRLSERKTTFRWHFRPDGKLVASSHQDGSIKVFDVASRACVYRLTPAGLVQGVRGVLHPTQPFVLTWSYYHPVVQVRDLQTGAVVASYTLPWNLGNTAYWSPDGRGIAAAESEGGKIQLLDFEAEPPALRPRCLIHGPDHGGTHVSYNPAGDRLAARGWNGIVRLFDVGTGQHVFSTHAQRAPSGPPLRFDRAGKRLAACRSGEREDGIGLWSVADARECRALIHPGAGVWNKERPPAIHPAGRLAALGLNDGVALFDLESGRELVHLPLGVSSVAFDGTGDLLTNCLGGCFRWPLNEGRGARGEGRAAAGEGQAATDSRRSPLVSRLSLGPPERLPFHGGHQVICSSRDGRVIAQAMFLGYGMRTHAGGWILHPNASQPRCVDAGVGMSCASVSRDGRWVAFGPHSARVNVYEAASGRRVWQSPADHHSYCRFSPDGRWLLSDAEGGRVYAAGSWEPGPTLGPGIPWDMTPDSCLAIVGQSNGVYRLVEVASGRVLARLEDPEQTSGPARFTPDGTTLVVAANNGLRVWDLRRIRQELKELGLDWDAPSYPAIEEKPATPLSVDVNHGELDRRLDIRSRSASDHGVPGLQAGGPEHGALGCVQVEQGAAGLLQDGEGRLRHLRIACALGRTLPCVGPFHQGA